MRFPGVLLLILAFQGAPAQSGFRVMFYNVENLFDTEDNSLTADEAFTPEGDYHWNKKRLYKKLNNLSRVILAAGEWDYPALAGLCETENRKVLEMLIRYTPLQKAGYQIIHYDSPDPRGIDVALLFRPEVFRPLFHQGIQPRDSAGNPLKTRDILYVKGILANTDTLHVFVNHWPSKYGGVAASLHKRFAVARTLKSLTDSIFCQGPAHVLIMGDLNDNPMDASVREILGACPDTLNCPSGFYNLMAPHLNRPAVGSHKYRGQWDIIDHIIVSETLFRGNLGLKARSGHIFRPEFLLTQDESWTGFRIFRTYNGRKYEGGFADHLPVYTDIIVTGKNRQKNPE